MPFGFNSVQTHADILNVLAKAQALNKEVVVSRSGRVAVEGRWGRFLRVRREASNGAQWTSNQKQQRNAAVVQSLKAAIARNGVDVDALPQEHHLRKLFNAVPASPTLPGVKVFSQGVQKVFPEFVLDDPSLDRFRPEDIRWAPGAQAAPAPGAALPRRRGADLPLPVIPAQALANPNAPDAPLPANVLKVHHNLSRLMHPPHLGIYRDELGQTNRFQYEVINRALGQELPKTLDRSQTYLYVLSLDAQGAPLLRLGFEHALRNDADSRLGHGSLTQDINPEAKAVIGGELRFNPERNGWEIDENSGRYGFYPEGLLADVGVTIGDILQYAAFRFEASGFRLSNINSTQTRQSMV
jgi:hypothetical protein